MLHSGAKIRFGEFIAVVAGHNCAFLQAGFPRLAASSLKLLPTSSRCSLFREYIHGASLAQASFMELSELGQGLFWEAGGQLRSFRGANSPPVSYTHHLSWLNRAGAMEETWLEAKRGHV